LNTSRLSISLLCAGAIALACGPVARNASSDSAAASAIEPPKNGAMLASSLDVSVGAEVVLALHITNTSGQPLEVRFASGQTHEFAVLDAGGREVWRWGADRMFTQALQTRTIAAGQTVTYEERWSPAGASGRFTAVGRLHSSNVPLEQRVEFTYP
jgi:hypothetical protein